MSEKTKKSISFSLYTLPVIFFVVCYFLIVTSGEDIYQGANTAPNIVGDAVAAFSHSARLADMFAWAVINFFDYTFSFGIDTIFRIVDVFAAFSIFYMATYMVLQRRPRLELLDSSLFCSLFLLVMLTSNGPTVYSGFSKIHNYLFITFFSFLFLIVVIRNFWKRDKIIKNLFLRNFLVFLLAFLFGLASNISGIVFLISLPLYSLYLKLTRQGVEAKEFFKNWGGSAIIGVILSLFLIYVVGPGLSDYETSSAYLVVCDYLPIREIFTDFGTSVVRILKHNVYNFGKFFLPFIVVGGGFITVFRKHLFNKKIKKSIFTLSERNCIVASGIFIVIHLLALSQIFYPTRLMFSIYLYATAVLLFILRRFVLFYKITVNRSFLVSVLATLSIGLIVVRGYFAIEYIGKVRPELERIRTSDEKVLCVPESIYKAPYIPYIHLNQEDFLVDWAMPQTLYEKQVLFCET